MRYIIVGPYEIKKDYITLYIYQISSQNSIFPQVKLKKTKNWA